MGRLSIILVSVFLVVGGSFYFLVFSNAKTNKKNQSKYTCKALVYVKSLPKGQKVRLDDLKVERIQTSKLQAKTVLYAPHAVGSITKHSVAKGSLVNYQDFDNPEWQKPVVVVKFQNKVKNGEKIRLKDLEVTDEDGNPSSERVDSIKYAVGKQAKRDWYPGEILTRKFIER